MSGRRERSLKPLVVAAVALLMAGLVAWAPAEAHGPAAASASASAKAAGPAYAKTKALTRVFTNADGSTYSFPSNTVTVTADQTRNLRGRQRILVEWKGAQPSGGRAPNPYGENGLQQEYPVVVMQCRGVDDPSLPKAQQLRPETCWTASVAQRSQITRSESESSWLHDRDAAAADKQRVSGMTPFPAASVCPTADRPPFATRLTPFVSAKGRTYQACDADHMAPEAAVGAAFPPNEIAAFTDGDGTGSVHFEVRSDVENESLGCSHKVACSVVVVPINGLSCDAPASPMTTEDKACRKGGRFAPGSSNATNEGADQAVSPSLWWSASNWKNRFSIPVTFGLPPGTCDILDPRAPTGFYGSELLAQAALQWAPAYCLNKKRFKFQLNQTSDEAGFQLMESGGGAAAVVSGEHERSGSDPVGYAPTAVTGFAIGYNIDRPQNSGELGNLKLNARLVAKLLTQSYLGSELGRGHPGMGDNPVAIMNDPEFQELNPGLSQVSQEAGATLLSLSNSSDLIKQLTEYIAADRAAMDFVNGKPDRWGMRVNPSYRKLEMPRSELPLLDEYVPPTNDSCRKANPAVYLSQIAAPVTTLRKIAEALLDSWPNVQTRCDYDPSTKNYKLGRVDRQSYGARFMLGLVSLGDAERYGLRTASLQTKAGSYVAPTEASIEAGVRLTEQRQARGPFVLDQDDVRKTRGAYPGTMVVYTAARLRNVPQADADKVAQFIRVSVTEGQQVGSGNGELPRGYLPIRSKGPTEKLYDAALAIADAVEKQKPAAVAPEDEPSDGSGSGGPGVGGGGAVTPLAPPAAAPSVAPPVAPPAAGPTEAVVTDPTRNLSSPMAGRLMPALLVLALLGIAVGSGLRFFVRPPRRQP
jgi:ABC-type phosphate transport system substrate-binding protein